MTSPATDRRAGGRLAKKRAIVVGAGQTPGPTVGNGRAISLVFAREGADLVLVDKDADSVGETAELVRKAGGHAEVVIADATVEADCQRIAAAAAGPDDRIDVLVNNVGINAGDTGPTSVDVALWERIMHVNTASVFLTCRAVLPRMRARHGGAIVNISSAATRVSMPMFAYKMSKAAVDQATIALADANARFGIRVNAVLPGLIDTPMGVDVLAESYGLSREEWSRRRDAKVPLSNQMGTAWDVAHAVLYLASDEAQFVTGVLLTVDGGQSIRVG
jgi:NAD(P)-dependent dehydrogenase (short-subunit alcohol dehydrogenase family)